VNTPTGEAPPGARCAPGSVGDEAARLLFAAQDWLHKNVGDPDTSKISTGAPECQWCPVCQVIAVLRGDRPEVTAKIAETQTALSGLLRALADAVSGASTGPHHQHNGTRVQKINLSDDLPDPE